MSRKIQLKNKSGEILHPETEVSAITDLVANPGGSNLSELTSIKIGDTSYAVAANPDMTGYATENYVNNKIDELVGTGEVAQSFDTIKEIADYLEDHGSDYAALVSAVNDKADASDIPTKISDLQNDSGFITGVDWDDVANKPTIPTRVGQLTNDEGYLTSSALNGYALQANVPSATSDLNNDSGFITGASLTGLATETYVNNKVAEVNVPSRTSDLTNDSGFITNSALSGLASENYVDTAVVNVSSAIPTNVSQLTNDAGYLTSHQSLANYALRSELPDSTSDLTNDSGFITSSALSGLATQQYVDTQIGNLLGDGQIAEAYDTLKEVADYLDGHDDYINQLQNIESNVNRLDSEYYNYIKNVNPIFVPDEAEFYTFNHQSYIVNFRKYRSEDGQSKMIKYEFTVKPNDPNYIHGLLFKKTYDIRPDGSISGTSSEHFDNFISQAEVDKFNFFWKVADTSRVSSLSGLQEEVFRCYVRTEYASTEYNTDWYDSYNASGNYLTWPFKVPTINDLLDGDKAITTDNLGVSLGNIDVAAAANLNIPTAVSQLTNDSGYLTSSSLSGYALSSAIPTDTSDLTNNAGFITSSALSTYAQKSELPEKVSDLTNDTGFITSAALQPYALANDVPTKVSDLVNDSGFLTSHQDISGKQDVLTAGAGISISNNNVISVSGVQGISYEVISEFPLAGESGKIYLKSKGGRNKDVYEEYIWVNNDFELIGNTQVDLTGYAQTANLATVATSGSYNDLSNKPTLFSGNYNDLTNKPNIPTRVSELTNDSFAPIGRDDILGAFNTEWKYKDMTAEQKEYYAQEAGMSNDNDVLFVGKYRLYFTSHWNYIEIRYSGNIEQGMNAYLGGARGYELSNIGNNRKVLRLTDAQGQYLDLAQVYANEVGGTLSEDFPDFVDFVSNGADLILDVEDGVMRLYSPTLEQAGEYPYFYNVKYDDDNVLNAARMAYQNANNRIPRGLDGGGSVIFNTINHESLSQDPVTTQTDIRVDNFSWYASQNQQYADDYEKENYIALHGTWLNANDNNIMSEAKCSVGTYDVQLMSDEGDANGDHISASLLLSNNDLTLSFSTYNYLNNNYTPGTDVEYSLKTVSEKAMSAIQSSDLAGYATQSWVGQQGFLTSHQDISGKLTAPTITSSDAGKVLKVNSTGTGWEVGTASGAPEIYIVNYASPNYTEAAAAYNAGKLVLLKGAAPDADSYAIMNYVSASYITFSKFLTSRSNNYAAFNTYYLKPNNTWDTGSIANGGRNVTINAVSGNPTLAGNEAALTGIKVGATTYSLAGYATTAALNTALGNIETILQSLATVSNSSN